MPRSVARSADYGITAWKTPPELILKPDLSTICLPACKVTLALGAMVKLEPAKIVSQASRVWVELRVWLWSVRFVATWQPAAVTETSST